MIVRRYLNIPSPRAIYIIRLGYLRLLNDKIIIICDSNHINHIQEYMIILPMTYKLHGHNTPSLCCKGAYCTLILEYYSIDM